MVSEMKKITSFVLIICKRLGMFYGLLFLVVFCFCTFSKSSFVDT